MSTMKKVKQMIDKSMEIRDGRMPSTYEGGKRSKSMRRIVTVQDISCLGQCSLTVALPVISACGIETAILPSAVLSTHTGGFTGYTFNAMKYVED